MRTVNRTTGSVLGALLAVLLFLPSTPAGASPGRDNSIEIGWGYLDPDAPPLDDSIAIRLAWNRRLADRWRIEAALTRATEIGIGAGAGLGRSRGLDFTLLDVGARWDAASWNGGRFQLVGGIGWRAISGSYGTVDDSPTAHLGAGVEIDLGRRLYLRPEVKARLVDELPDETADLEATLSLGVRF